MEFLADLSLGYERNLESKMWKVSHYKLIEEYRKQLKVLTLYLYLGNLIYYYWSQRYFFCLISHQALQSQKSSENRQMYHHVLLLFKEFLNYAASFYLDLIGKIGHLFGIVNQSVLDELGLVLDTYTGKIYSS